MSIYSNVTELDLINLRKLAEQQKNQRAIKIKNRILKQTHDVKLAESLSPITKKLDEVNKSAQESLLPFTRKLDTVNESIKESNPENNKEIAITPSILLEDTLKSLSGTPTSLKLNKDNEDNLSILGVALKSFGGDKIQVSDNIYEFTPELHRALSQTSYTGKSMKNEDGQRNLCNFLVDVGYTGRSEEKTNQNFFYKTLQIVWKN